MEIKAADVMRLRKATNAGMMDCKKALIEAEGDFDAAVDIIRKKGLAIAAKRADREAKEGCVIAVANGNKGVVVSLNCETDFVAKNEGFIALTKKIAEYALETMPADLEALLALQMDGRSIADIVSEQTGVIGAVILNVTALEYYEVVSVERVAVQIKHNVLIDDGGKRLGVCKQKDLTATGTMSCLDCTLQSREVLKDLAVCVVCS